MSAAPAQTAQSSSPQPSEPTRVDPKAFRRQYITFSIIGAVVIALVIWLISGPATADRKPSGTANHPDQTDTGTATQAKVPAIEEAPPVQERAWIVPANKVTAWKLPGDVPAGAILHVGALNAAIPPSYREWVDGQAYDIGPNDHPSLPYLNDGYPYALMLRTENHADIQNFIVFYHDRRAKIPQDPQAWRQQAVKIAERVAPPPTKAGS